MARRKSLASVLIRNKEHYVRMHRKFLITKIGKVAWVVNFIVTVGCFLAFCFIDGKELLLALYIPLDMALNVSKAMFFFFEYHKDQKSVHESEKHDHVELNSSRQTEITEPLLSWSNDTDSDCFKEDPQTIRKREIKNNKNAQDDNYLLEVVNSSQTLGLGDDTYALAFKALNLHVLQELELKITEVHNCVHSAFFVFGFQILMIFFVYSITKVDSFQILLPANVSVLVSRFLCSILMHITVESDIR